MADDHALLQKLVQALRRIEADAEGALTHGGALRKTLETIRDYAGQTAADAAKQAGTPGKDSTRNNRVESEGH